MRAEERFAAMGSDAHVVAVGGDAAALAGRARERVVDLEGRWSRFRPGSEISRLNSGAGAPVVVSRVTFVLVSRALRGWQVTGGRFDPTVLGDVVRAGYDRDFAAIGTGAAPGASRCRWRRGCAGVVLDPRSRLVWLPDGVALDPGGVAKGVAADVVARETMAAGAEGVCVNLGGDLRVRGAAPDGGAWRIDVADPWTGSSCATVSLGDGAMATSARTRRTWSVAGEERHHILDPATGRPAARGLASVTVVAARGWQAEVLAKGAFVGGVAGAKALLEERGVAGLLVGDDAVTTEVGSWAEFATSRRTAA